MLRDFFSNEEAKALDPMIDRIKDEMKDLDVGSEGYHARMEYLERLFELKAKERREPLSRDTVALVAGNFLTAVVVLRYERFDVITSKAKDFLLRLSK